jgi:hypothetical protein
MLHNVRRGSAVMLQYEHLTEDELLHVADEREQLTDEARLALDSELRRRSLSTSEIDTYKQKCANDNKADELRRAKRQVVHNVGLGKKFFGKTNCRRDPSGLFELCESTLWFVVLWFPVYPIATYTVRRDLERWMGKPFASTEIALGRHPRNWEMILFTWVKASAFVLALRLLFLIMLRHPAWLRHF